MITAYGVSPGGRYLSLLMILLLVMAPFPRTHHSPPISSGDPVLVRTGLVIPLYTYPGPTWQIVLQAKHDYPALPMIVIINPGNGPGSTIDAEFSAGVASLRGAGILVLGYVYTSYGNRNSTDVMTDIYKWKQWYGVNGIFFDEMSSVPGHERYYENLSDYAGSLGLNLTMANPSYMPPRTYLGIMTIVNIFEGPSMPTTEQLRGWTYGYAKSDFALISIAQGKFSQSLVTNASNYVGWVFITDGVMPNPYDQLPSYFTKLVEAVGGYTIPPLTVGVSSSGSGGRMGRNFL